MIVGLCMGMQVNVYRPVDVAEWEEHPSPILRDWGIRRSRDRVWSLWGLKASRVKPKSLKLTLVASPSPVLGIIRIGKGLVGSVSG